MPRRESRRSRLPTCGYRDHRLAIWGVTGCVAVAAGLALTAGLAAASPQLGNIPGTTDRRPALAGLPTVNPGTDPAGPPDAGPGPSSSTGSDRGTSLGGTASAEPSARPSDS